MTPDERSEIEQISAIAVNGGDPFSYPEFEESRSKWGFILRLYDISRNPRYGNLEHLPTEGGLLDQPCKTIEALQVCVIAYQEKLSNDMEKMASKVRR